MSTLKPIILHSHVGPTPWKVALLFEELGIPYTNKVHSSADLKEPEFLAINPRGLTPTIEDPNTGIVLSESQAIFEYVLEQYDTSHLVSFAEATEKWRLREQLSYQTSTQNPIGHFVWFFKNIMPLPEMKDEFLKRTLTLFHNMNTMLEEEQWLVGGKCSAADLAFVPHHSALLFFLGPELPDMNKEFPALVAWWSRLKERRTVQNVLAARFKVVSALQPANK